MKIIAIGNASDQIDWLTTQAASASMKVEITSLLSREEFEQYTLKGRADCVCIFFPLTWGDGLEIVGTIRNRFTHLPIVFYGDDRYHSVLSSLKNIFEGSFAVSTDQKSLVKYLQQIDESDSNPLSSETIFEDPFNRLDYEAVYQKAEDAIFIMRQYEFIECNEKTERLFDLPKEKIIGSTPIDFSPEIQPDGQESRTKAKEKVSRALDGIPQRFEWRHTRADGTEFDTEVILHSLHHKDGDILQAVVRDITERKQSEQRIRELSQYPEENPSPVYRFSMDGTLIYVNKAGYKILDHFDLKPGDSLPKKWMEKLSGYFSNEITEPMEYYFEDKFYSFIFSWNEETDYVTVYGHDITETKRSQRALAESEERYRAFVQNSFEGIFLLEIGNDLPENLTKEERIRWYLEHTFVSEANESTANIMGVVDIEELQGITLGDILERTDQDPAEIVHDYVASDFRLSNRLIHWKGFDNRVRLVQANVIGTTGSNNVLRSWGSIRDITEQKQREEALKESEERFRLLAENIPGIVYLGDNDYEFTMEYLNDTIEEMTGYPKEEFLSGSLHYGSLIHEEDLEEVHREIDKAVEKHRPFHLMYRVRHKSGEWRWFEEFGSGIFKEDQLMFLEGFITDITERRQAEQTIRESEARFRALTQSITAIIFIYKDDELLYVNSTAQKTIGLPQEELLGKKVWDFVHPDYRDIVKDYAQANLNNIQLPEEFEFKLLTASGEEVWLEANMTSVDYKGETAILGTGFDITGRKKSEFIQSAIFRISEAARTEKSLDEVYADIHSIIRELMPAKNLYIALVDETNNQISFPYFVDQNETRAEPREIGNGITEYVLRSGEPFLATTQAIEDLESSGEITLYGTPSFHWLGVPLKTKDKNIGVLAVQSYDKDVHYTEKEKDILNFVSMQVATTIARKQTEAELSKERQQLAVTLQSIGDGVIATNTEGRIELVNRVAEDLIERSRADVEGEKLIDVLFPSDGTDADLLEKTMKRVVATREIATLPPQTLLRSKMGQKRVVADSIAPLNNDQQEVIGTVMVLRDETEKHRMEMELLKSRKLESVGTLAGGIAHDFNNILAGILGYISLARLNISKPEKVESLIKKTENAVQRASKLTNQLLTFSKGGAPVKETASIEEVIEESVQFALHGSNVKCDLEIADDLWLVEIDTGQIDQVLQNIIINADQAMPAGGSIVVSAENTRFRTGKGITSIRPGKYVKLTVKDQGMGVPEENLDKIFDPYFTTKEMGNGLGLATAYSIVDKHGGYIKANSNSGEGTTITIFLPATGKSKTLKKPEEDEYSELQGGKILVMDDEETVLEVVSEMLLSLGYSVETALDGVEAIEKYQAANERDDAFSLVIIDLTIPGGMGGVETTKKLREIDEEVKVIVSSGYSNDPVMANYEDHGFDAKVAKPYDMKKLSTALAQITAVDGNM